jgi:hypothetical protein
MTWAVIVDPATILLDGSMTCADNGAVTGELAAGGAGVLVGDVLAGKVPLGDSA